MSLNKGPYTISIGFRPKLKYEFFSLFSVSLMDLMISGNFLEFSSGLFTKIFMYRFPCISGLKLKKEEFQRDKKYAYSIFHGEFKSSAKKILVLWEGGQNHKKHLEVQYFCEYDFFFTFDKFFRFID